MLIVSRKKGQGLRIGPAILLRVLEIRGSRIRLGIEAPAGVSVCRQEVGRQTREHNLQALELNAEILPGLLRSVASPPPSRHPLGPFSVPQGWRGPPSVVSSPFPAKSTSGRGPEQQ